MDNIVKFDCDDCVYARDEQTIDCKECPYDKYGECGDFRCLTINEWNLLTQYFKEKYVK